MVTGYPKRQKSRDQLDPAIQINVASRRLLMYLLNGFPRGYPYVLWEEV